MTLILIVIVGTYPDWNERNWRESMERTLHKCYLADFRRCLSDSYGLICVCVTASGAVYIVVDGIIETP